MKLVTAETATQGVQLVTPARASAEGGYSAKQFQRDLKKADKRLEEMADAARADLKAGKGRKFPE